MNFDYEIMHPHQNFNYNNSHYYKYETSFKKVSRDRKLIIKVQRKINKQKSK